MGRPGWTEREPRRLEGGPIEVRDLLGVQQPCNGVELEPADLYADVIPCLQATREAG